MVNSNSGLPEPPQTSDDHFSVNTDVILATDSEDDEENNYEGYQPLPLNPEEAHSDTEEEENSDNAASASASYGNSAAASSNSVPPIERAEESLVKEVWASAPPKDIEMDSSKVDEVKQAMLNFSLPERAIPEWANNVPEETWKATLLNCIQNSNRRNPE